MSICNNCIHTDVCWVKSVNHNIEKCGDFMPVIEADIKRHIEGLEDRICALNYTNQMLEKSQVTYTVNRLKEFFEKLKVNQEYHVGSDNKYVPWIKVKDMENLLINTLEEM